MSAALFCPIMRCFPKGSEGALNAETVAVEADNRGWVEVQICTIAIQKIIVISGSQLYETIPDKLPA